MTKEKPILFNDWSVNGVLAGRKTMTRRPMKLQPKITMGYDKFECAFVTWKDAHTLVNTGGGGTPESILQFMAQKRAQYQVGDRLWVREAYKLEHAFDENKPSEVDYSPVLYLADNSVGNITPTDGTNGTNGFTYGRYRHARFMPKKFARIWLKVTEVKAQRVQDITEEDALAEGVYWDGYYFRGGIHPVKKTLQCWNTEKEAFKAVWNSIYGEGAWEENPWVWVVEFKRVKGGMAKEGSDGK